MHRATRLRTILLAAVLMVSGCAATVSGNPRAGDDRSPLGSGPELTETQLAAVLLDAPQINDIMGSNAMAVVKTYDHMPSDQGATYSDPTCAGAAFNTIETAYQGSRYVAVRGSALNEPGEQFTHYVDQGVVSFGSGRDAGEFLSTSRQLWGRCVGKHVTSTPTGGKTGTWTMRTPVTASGITAAIVDKEAGDGYACAHGITAKSNVVIDVAACGYAIADQGATPMTRVSNLVNAIAGKFPA